MRFSKTKIFVTSDCRNASNNYQLVTLPNFAKFHPQTTDIQPFKVKCFSMKTLKFQHDYVIICDVSGGSDFLACGTTQHELPLCQILL